MADYQEYRRRVLHKRWRRVLLTASSLLLLLMLLAINLLWRSLQRDTRQTATVSILAQEIPGTEWKSAQYVAARSLTVQKTDDGQTALDFRMAALPQTPAVDASYFTQASFLGDSLTQGMQIYNTGLPNANFCAYKGVGPNAVVNGTTCKRHDGAEEVPMEALAAQQPKVLYVLLGTNVLGRDGDYTNFLTYYRLMLDMIHQQLPDTIVYVQSITPVRPEVSAQERHAGLNKDRLCRINDELAAIALEKNCYFLNLWEALADENGDLKAEYAQPDGYHLKPEGYTAWVEYLSTHTVSAA